MKKEKNNDLPIPLRPIRIRHVKDAARLLGRVLMQLQKEEISENKAKTISYVANSFIKACEVSSLAARIDALEADFPNVGSIEGVH